jgi:hypothetical protein
LCPAMTTERLKISFVTPQWQKHARLSMEL